MKLDEFLKTQYDISREDFKKLPIETQNLIRKLHSISNQKRQSKTAVNTGDFDYDRYIAMSLDQIKDICSRPVPRLTSAELDTLADKLNTLIDNLTADYIDDVITNIKNAKLESLGLGAKIYVRQDYVPYWYDENYKYLDLDKDDDLKTFIAQELDNELIKCDPDEIGVMAPDVETSWPFRLLSDKYEPINPESLFLSDIYDGNLSDEYMTYIADQLLSPKYFDIPLELYFYQDLDDMTRRKLGTLENFKNKVTNWLETHNGKTLRDKESPYDLCDYEFELTSDIDNYMNYEDELHDVITNKIADLWNDYYLPHAKELFDQQNKEVDQQVSSVSNELQQKYQAEIDKTSNPKLAKSLLAMTLLNHIAKTLSDRNTDMTDPLNKRLANKYDENIIYSLKDDFLQHMWKNRDKYPEMSTTVYIPEEPDKYHVYFCEEHNEDRRMTMLSPMEYYWYNKKTVDACPDCQVDHIKNYYSFYYFSFDLGNGNNFSYHLPYPIGKSWLPKLSKFKHVHQEFDEDSPFLFGTEADKDEILYALSHDLIKDVKETMK